MKITATTPLRRVAVLVGDALRRSGIDAVLTGGACATVHSGGAYQSLDIDFVLRSTGRLTTLDAAMRSLGFVRARQRYEHPASPYFVEFLPAPLAIGADTDIRPVLLTAGGARTRALSATDATRDRLAAFYHWQDRSSLAAALAIAARHRINLARIGRWSRTEGAVEEFEGFVSALRRRVTGRKSHPSRRT
jgi:hypothetical protein